MVTLILAPNASIPARLSRIPRLRQWCDHDEEKQNSQTKKGKHAGWRNEAFVPKVSEMSR